ncbi:unnamed protein product [Cercospora beticola]|nr:unnamed protein product [Cercospora beticola]
MQQYSSMSNSRYEAMDLNIRCTGATNDDYSRLRFERRRPCKRASIGGTSDKSSNCIGPDLHPPLAYKIYLETYLSTLTPFETRVCRPSATCPSWLGAWELQLLEAESQLILANAAALNRRCSARWQIWLAHRGRNCAARLVLGHKVMEL